MAGSKGSNGWLNMVLLLNQGAKHYITVLLLLFFKELCVTQKKTTENFASAKFCIPEKVLI